VLFIINSFFFFFQINLESNGFLLRSFFYFSFRIMDHTCNTGFFTSLHLSSMRNLRNTGWISRMESLSLFPRISCLGSQSTDRMITIITKQKIWTESLLFWLSWQSWQSSLYLQDVNSRPTATVGIAAQPCSTSRNHQLRCVVRVIPFGSGYPWHA
jgi:hypothetical protein